MTTQHQDERFVMSHRAPPSKEISSAKQRVRKRSSRLTQIVTGCTADWYPVKANALHCCKAEFNWNGNAMATTVWIRFSLFSPHKVLHIPGSAVSHEAPEEAPTNITSVVPPAAKPVESDIVRTNLLSFASWSFIV
jgi:hypothetical protein